MELVHLQVKGQLGLDLHRTTQDLPVQQAVSPRLQVVQMDQQNLRVFGLGHGQTCRKQRGGSSEVRKPIQNIRPSKSNRTWYQLALGGGLQPLDLLLKFCCLVLEDHGSGKRADMLVNLWCCLDPTGPHQNQQPHL